MDNSAHERTQIDFVIGQDRKLSEVIDKKEIYPILKAALKAGASEAVITDMEGKPIWQVGEVKTADFICQQKKLILEGEPVGQVVVMAEKARPENVDGIMNMLFFMVDAMMNNCIRRLLTTEIHTKVVKQSYQELVNVNKQLRASEQQYKDLACHLEMKVRERTEALKRAQVTMLEQEKMASIGQLAAGVAHEINNPMSFVLSNFSTLKKYADRFKEAFSLVKDLLSQEGQSVERVKDSFDEKWKSLKMDYVLGDLNDLLDQSIDGSERVKKIVSDLKGFSHIDDGEEAHVNINEEVDRCLSVLNYSVPEGTIIDRDYQSLPLFRCQASLLGQVFLNIFTNAFQAKPQGLRLKVLSRVHGEFIDVSVADNGPGLPEEIRKRVFEPFFTTKGVGEGTGMGLTVVYDIVKSFSGQVEISSVQGKGTEITLRFPCNSHVVPSPDIDEKEAV